MFLGGERVWLAADSRPYRSAATVPKTPLIWRKLKAGPKLLAWCRQKPQSPLIDLETEANPTTDAVRIVPVTSELTIVTDIG